MTPKTLKFTAISALVAACALSMAVQAATVDEIVAQTAQAPEAGAPVPPAPPAPAGQPRGFNGPDTVIIGDVRGPGPRPDMHPGQGPRPDMRPGPRPDARPIIVTDGYDYDRPYYRHHRGYRGDYGPGYAQDYGRGYGRGYGPGCGYAQDCPYRSLSDIMSDERYSEAAAEIDKLEDLLFVERNVLQGLRQDPESSSAEIRAQAKTVVDLKNRLDAQYDKLMQQYVEDNGADAVPGYYQDGRRPHHFMRHHRNWHHW